MKLTQIQQKALELAELMNLSPELIDRELIKSGFHLIGFFEDNLVSEKRFPLLPQFKIHLILKAIDDIASGLMLMKSCRLCLLVRNNEVRPSIIEHGADREGEVIMTIGWKDVMAFQRWRKANALEVEQDAINSAIYALSHELGKQLEIVEASSKVMND